MSTGFIVEMIRSAVFLVLQLAAPMLLAGLLVGLLVSIFQATTSIQEQTLTFVPKIAAILIVLVFSAEWIFTSLREYTVNLFQLIPSISG
ncbi:MAG: flagellar biosynthesis protein FliQ [Spirochaetales bacterium]|uniref:Flagellar biosynthetic protein FliQ n=1 Tax=Candidatus Thalassospirochaeta sargassi TaxID=3119039 RepID=A0AAJ1ML75_9SPIO|nr:flagellar biosynthesis protein FliQ [Spirochaetales bacterium]